MPSIVVLDGHTTDPGDNPFTALEALGTLTVHERTPRESLFERAEAADVLVTNKTPLDAALLSRLPRLKGIAVLATGVNVVDVEAATRERIPVCNVPAYGSAAVAQHTFALLLELCHRVGLHDESVHAGQWTSCPDFSF